VARSPQVRTHAFTAQPPDLRHLASITRASRFHTRSPCSGNAFYPVFVHRLAVSLHTLFGRSLKRVTPTPIGRENLLAALAVDAGPCVNRKAIEIRPLRSPPPGRTIALAWRKRAPFPETFERLAAPLKASLPTEMEPV